MFLTSFTTSFMIGFIRYFFLSMSFSLSYLKIIFAVCITTMLFRYTAIMYEFDFWWHLRIGDWILKHHALMRTDEFSFTMSGFVWYDHEWLTNIVMAQVWKLGGQTLETILFGIIISTLAIMWTIRARSIAEMGLIFLSLFSLGTFLGPRPQVLSFLLFALTIFIWYHKLEHKKYLTTLPLIFILWANTYGGVLFGVAFIGLAACGQALERTLTRFKLLIAILCIAATLINPFGIHLYTEAIRTQVSPAMKNITEMQAGFSGFDALAPLLTLCIVVGLFFHVRNRWWSIIIPVTFFFLAFVHAIKFWPYFVLIGLESLHLIWPQLIAWCKRYSLCRDPRMQLVVALLCVQIVGLGLWVAFQKQPWAQYPVEATKYLAQLVNSGAPVRIYNEFDFGGYIGWQIPQLKIFVDGHMPQWIDERGYSAFSDAAQISHGSPSAALEAFKKFDINTAIFSAARTQNQIVIDTLIAAGWREVYRDSIAVIIKQKP